MAKARKRRRKLSMTSLIDVIFLLLLFFMLTSTFSKFSEVELAAAAGVGTPKNDTPPVFMQLAKESINLNGDEVEMTELTIALPDTEATLIVALKDDVDAQRLTNLLVALREFPKITVSVLGGA
ncbi:MAG: biopolymer transporter ExbD [Litoreibacter sp.]|uniref:biopolymer transporter ExbD n=1 Tax=Litoreibacter sp. TaxID=1969459 RepID=UPI0032995C7D